MRVGSPIAQPGKVICIGLNYSNHAEESGMPTPAEPIVFLKASNTVVGPYDDVRIPRGSQKTDWEVELGVVIGKEARYLGSAEESPPISLGSQSRMMSLSPSSNWSAGDNGRRARAATRSILGPFLVTPNEAGDPQSLSMRLSVNGLERQRGNTAKMIFSCYSLVHYLSQFMTLEPGDLISTGTPPGVGLGLKSPTYLKNGDVVELAIEKLGRQRQTFVTTE
jgi:2-keto-4-pentenoate hydratase/2-oxohepta-3-ene-1,7-dioic acid hydratase in catechol pathway